MEDIGFVHKALKVCFWIMVSAYFAYFIRFVTSHMAYNEYLSRVSNIFDLYYTTVLFFVMLPNLVLSIFHLNMYPEKKLAITSLLLSIIMWTPSIIHIITVALT